MPIIGIVENMSIHICSKCGHEEHIFGTGGGETMCKDYEVPSWRSALDIQIRMRSRMAACPPWSPILNGRVAEIYKGIAAPGGHR